MAGERWATFDCYGTLIDWLGGIRGTLVRLWPARDPQPLLDAYLEVEAEVQRGRALPYREVLALSLEQLAAHEGLDLAADDRPALADALPTWPPFPEVPSSLAEVLTRGWRIGILSNTDPDLLDASLGLIGVPVDLRITAAEAGSYKPAHGHWDRFFEETGADEDRHVHVAASWFHDLVPAAELGLASVWINRLGEMTDARRMAEQPDLTGLADTLDGLVPA